KQADDEHEEGDSISFIAYFDDFENVIALSKTDLGETLTTKLFSLDNKYYLYTEFPFEYYTEEDIDNAISIILEFDVEAQRTYYYLQEYGKEVISENVFEVLRKHF